MHSQLTLVGELVEGDVEGLDVGVCLQSYHMGTKCEFDITSIKR